MRNKKTPSTALQEEPSAFSRDKACASSCQGSCNTHPSLKPLLRHRREHTLVQNLSTGEGGFPREALLQECSAQLAMATETVEPKRSPLRANATCAWADICQATWARSHCHLPAAAGSSTPPPMATSPREAPSLCGRSWRQRHQTSAVHWASPSTYRVAGG